MLPSDDIARVGALLADNINGDDDDVVVDVDGLLSLPMTPPPSSLPIAPSSLLLLLLLLLLSCTADDLITVFVTIWCWSLVIEAAAAGAGVI